MTSPDLTITSSPSSPKATSLGRRTASLFPLRKVRLRAMVISALWIQQASAAGRLWRR